MNVFFSDLDNTIIYSHRHELSGEKIPVEYLKGREQSYMTRMTYYTLKELKDLELVPVSTRSFEQYKRINCMDDLKVKYAIICNGGKLISEGQEDEEWAREVRSEVLPYVDDLERAIEALKPFCGGKEIKRPEIYMAYIRLDNSEEVTEKLKKEIEPLNVYVTCDHSKLYLFIKGIDKGSALRRFKKRFNVEHCAAAGDSVMDIPMLNEADLALVSEAIASEIFVSKKVIEGEDISGKICKHIRNFDLLNRLKKQAKIIEQVKNRKHD